jgi:beta-lactamase regulating signal transducer with metallopeptidase domain
MNALLPVLVPSLAWALLDFIWQGLLVGWAAALVLGLLRGARPQVRYAVACAALLLCAALPLAGTLQRVFDAHAATTALLPLALADNAGAAAATIGPAAIDRLALWEQRLQAQLPLVMLLWAAGAAALALRMMLGLAWVHRRSLPAHSRPDAAWQASVTRLATRLGIARPVRLGLVDDLASPVTAGWWRPVILLPASLASGMPVGLLEALLAHELAHIKRHDYLVNLVQSAIEIVLFYHPAVWWLSNRIRLEREQIADDLAASMLGEPRRLALALSELDRFQLATNHHLAHAAHGGNLMNRIKRLVRPESEPLNWKMALPILGLSAACAAFYANAQTTPAAPAAPAAAVAPATRAAPAAAPKPHPRSEHRPAQGSDNGYALVRPNGHGASVSGNGADWSDIEAAKRKIPGDFLWFRQGGKAYVVRDPGVLARAIDAWAPVDRLGEEMNGYGREMDQHGKVMEALGRDMEKAAGNIDRKPDRAFERKMAALSRQQEQLGRQMEKLGSQMEDANGARRDSLNRQMEQLGQKMGELGRQMEQQSEGYSAQHERLQQAQAPMEEIGRKMEEAGKPMDALGKQMDVLGKQIEKESQAADKVVRGLIQDAMAKGLAEPAPAG